MKIVTPSLEIGKNDSFKNDVLNRKAYGESLLNLVQRSNDELVISLDGQWGEGKTTFVKMWQGLLNESNIPNIYIDTFSIDYLDDAFVSVVSSITKYAEENIVNANNDKVSDFREKSIKIGGQLLAWTSKVAIKAATLGAIKEIDIDELKDIKGDLAKGTSNVIENFISERLASHEKNIELMQSFKILLSELPSQFENGNGNPLVVIIDELDRCKPTFAIEMLEKIKHIFSVKNVVFVLVMHKGQLEEAIKCIYGKNIDAHAYLQKFINLEAQLPKQTGDRRTNDFGSYSQKLLELHELETWGDDRKIVECLEPLANHFNLSLRQLEKVFTNLAIFYGASAENELRIISILVFLSVIKVVRPKMFEHLLHQKITYTEVCKETKLNHEKDQHRKLYLLMSWVRFSLLTEQEFEALDNKDRIKGFTETLWNYGVDRENLILIFAQQISMFVVRC